MYDLCMSKSKPEIKRRKTFQLRLTQLELLHIRDLMTICLPPEGKQTVSEALSTLENRQLIEAMLWKKVSSACKQADLPLGEDAPDYVVATMGIPSMGVFHLASDLPQANLPGDDEENDPLDISKLFSGKKKDDL